MQNLKIDGALIKGIMLLDLLKAAKEVDPTFGFSVFMWTWGLWFRWYEH